MTNSHTSIPETIDEIHIDFSNYIRQLKQKKAFASIFVIVEYFLAILNSFNLSSDEYVYYLDKYSDAAPCEEDLTRSEILGFLKSLILRIEAITGQKFKSEEMKLSSAEIMQKNEEENIRNQVALFPDLAEILEETISEVEKKVEPAEPVEIIEKTEPVEMVESMKKVEPVEPVDDEKKVEPSESGDGEKKVEPIEPVESEKEVELGSPYKMQSKQPKLENVVQTTPSEIEHALTEKTVIFHPPTESTIDSENNLVSDVVNKLDSGSLLDDSTSKSNLEEDKSTIERESFLAKVKPLKSLTFSGPAPILDYSTKKRDSS
ncbi:MAG: hypothetical protein ACTSVU_10120 [Promethearchaeota archaeon]